MFGETMTGDSKHVSLYLAKGAHRQHVTIIDLTLKGIVVV